jgi:excisionase family DNA binding protein
MTQREDPNPQTSPLLALRDLARQTSTLFDRIAEALAVLDQKMQTDQQHGTTTTEPIPGTAQNANEKLDAPAILSRLRYTRAEASDLLRIHVNTLDRLIRRGRIKAAYSGMHVFIHREELDRYARGENTRPRKLWTV